MQRRTRKSCERLGRKRLGSAPCQLLRNMFAVVVAFVGQRGQGRCEENKKECSEPDHEAPRPESVAACRGATGFPCGSYGGFAI